MLESIDLRASKVAFWTKNHDFWRPFWHRFFNCFRKGRKCKISEEYNTKRGFEVSNSFDFHIGFSLNVQVFSESPLRSHFWRIQAPMYTQKYDFGAILDSAESLKQATWSVIIGKKASKSQVPLPGVSFWSRLGRDMAPKTFQGRTFIDVGSFSN